MKRFKYNFVYKTSNIKTGRYYIGVHSTNNLDDGYLGSGVKLIKSIQYHGREQHEREILYLLPSREDAINKEIEIVNEDLLSDPMCMNMVLGGLGSMSNGWESGGRETAKLIKNDPLLKEKYQKLGSSVFKKLWEDPKKSEVLRNAGANAFKDKKHTEETKIKMSKAASKRTGDKNHRFGRVWVYNESRRESITIDKSELSEYLKFGWKKGRKIKF